MPIDVDRAIAAPGSDIVNTNLRRDVLAMLGARATVGLVNVAIIALVAQALGPAGQGRVAVGLAVTLLAVQLGTFGLTAATTVWIARDPSVIPDVLGIVRWWALGIGISAGLALAVFTISTDTLSLTSGDALAIAVATPFLMAATLQQGALLGLGRARPMNAAEAGAGLFALGSVALTVFAFDGGATAALGAALLQFPVAALGYSFLLRDHRPLRKRPNRTTAAAMLRFARKPFAAAALTFFVVRSDLILIDGFLGPADAGLYAAAVTTSQAVYLVPLVIGINLLPRAARTGTAALTSRLLRRLIVPYGVLCLGLGALAAPVISVVFGDEYQPSVELLRWLMPGTFAFGLVAVISYHFAATEYPRQAIAMWALALAGNVTANAMLLPSYGVEAAAVISSVTYTAVLVAHAAIFWRGLEAERSTLNQALEEVS